jgi:spoIIIJ-associated protein
VTEVPEKNPKHKKNEYSIQAVTDFCRQLSVNLGMEFTIEGKEEDGVICINISGADRSSLLSNSASLLNNLEYLLNKIFRSNRDESRRIILDSDHYRKHREAELILLSQMASKKVISFRKPLSLQPMIPGERKIVHLALSGIEGVRSQSEGEGDNRSITIYPSQTI